MPTIAVLGSGGGLRAMIALLGTLMEMKNQGLLDAVMYLCGVSGSTWSMSLLYDDKDWTENVQNLEKRLCDALVKDSRSLLKSYDIVSKAADDELFSLTDVWASFFVYPILDQYDQTKLSQHQEASANGTNPYPIYAAVEASKVDVSVVNSPGTWFELTPHESGFPGLEAFVCTEGLGSKFHNGTLKEKKEEKNICYLQGDPKFTDLAKDKVIKLIDATHAINSAYPLVLRPERKVKLILSFDFSDGDPFETIEKTVKYCEENQIPFPKIDLEKLTDTDDPSHCYIFKGQDVPTVMHFPLFNNKNCPGEIQDFRNRFSTFKLFYQDDEVKQLLDKAKLNVSSNREVILKEIQQIVSSSTKEF